MAEEVTVAPPANGATQPGATASNPAPVEPKQPEAPRVFTQEEVNAVVKQRLEREQRKFERERDELRRLALQGKDQPKADAPKDPTAKPTRESYADYEQYVEALAEWKADRKFEERETKRREDEAKSQAMNEQQRLHKAHVEREAKVREKYPDYEEKALNPDLAISDAMAHAIMLSDNGADVAYYLGSHPDEAKRISELPPLKAAAEIGRIEAKLASEPPTVTPSKAPAPIKPVGASKAGAASDEPKDSDPPDVWRRKRERQLGLRT